MKKVLSLIAFLFCILFNAVGQDLNSSTNQSITDNTTYANITITQNTLTITNDGTNDSLIVTNNLNLYFGCLGTCNGSMTIATNARVHVDGNAIVDGTGSVLTIQSGATLYVEGTFRNDNSVIIQDGGTIIVDGAFQNDGTIDVQDGGTLIIKSTYTNTAIGDVLTMAGPTSVVNITGTVENGGTITIAGDFDCSDINNENQITVLDGSDFHASGNYVAFLNNDLLEMTGPTGTVVIDGTVTNAGDIITNDSFSSGTFITNDFLDVESGTATITGDFNNIFDVFVRNNANLVVTGNFTQAAGDELRMTSSVTSTVTIGGSLTTDGIVTVYNSFTAGSIANNGTFNLEGSPTLTLTSGNFENNSILYLNNTTTNGDIIINTGTDTLKNNFGATALTGIYIDYNSLTINGNLFLQTNMTVDADQTLSVTGNVEIHDDATDSENNTLTLNGVSDFGSTLLTNTNLDENGSPLGNDRTKLVINNNLTVTGGVTFNNASYFRASNDYGISRAIVELNVGTIDLDSDITFITGEISGDMSVDNGAYYDAEVDNVFNAVSIATTSSMTVDGQITFGTDTTANPNFITTNGGNFILVNSNDVHITFTHGEPFINYQGGMRTDDTYIFGTNESGGDLIFATDSTHLVLPTHPNNSFPDILVEGTCDTVVTAYKTQTDQIKGTLYIGHDGVDRVIKLVDGANFDGFETSSFGAMRIGIDSNAVVTDANCIYFMKDSACTNGIPEFAGTDISGGGTKFQFNDSTIFEFNVSAGKSFEILTETTRGQYTVYPRVYLTGAGEKVCNIDNGAFLVFTANGLDYIELTEGDLTFAAGSDFVLTNKLGFGGILQTFNAATINIEGDFGEGPTADVRFGDETDRRTTVNYRGNGTAAAQTIYQFYQDGFSDPTPDDPENYDILKISNPLGICSTDDGLTEIQIGTRLDIEANAQLRLVNDIRLLSDATYTAYVSEITTPSPNTIEYDNGEFIVEKYLDYTKFIAADITSPILDFTLGNLQSQGVRMEGFPGADVPGARFRSVAGYDETVPGDETQGFYTPTNINDPFFLGDQGTGVTRSAYRVNFFNEGTRLLKDTGEIRYGTVKYDLSHTPSTPTNEADGMVMIGNPYPAPIDLNKVATLNAGLFNGVNLDDDIFMSRYEDSGSSKEKYSTYNTSSGDLTNTTVADSLKSIVPAHNVFYVKTLAGYDGTTKLVIDESCKADIEESYTFKAEKKKKATISLLVNGTKTDQISLIDVPKTHPTNKEIRWDTRRFSSKLKSNSLNFSSDNGESLNLYVNAFDTRITHVRIPILLNLSNTGTYNLSLENMDAITASYECISLLNLATNESYMLDNDNEFTFTTTEKINDVRFVLEMKKDATSNIIVHQPACADEKGVLNLNLHTQKPEQIVISSDNGFNTTLVTNNSKYRFENLEPGIYTIKNIHGLLNCDTNQHSFTIDETPSMFTDLFTVSDSLITRSKPVIFTAKGSAYAYMWEIDGETKIGQEISYQFSNLGTHKVNLIASNQSNTCIEQQYQTFEVQSLTGITELVNTNNFFTLDSKYLNINQNLDISTVYLYDTQGKIIAKNFNRFDYSKLNGMFILKIKGINTTQSFKLLF